MWSGLEETLEKYAELILKVGARLQAGDKLIISQAPLETRSLVKHIHRKAYELGAAYVHVTWREPSVKVDRLSYAPSASFHEYHPTWIPAAKREIYETMDALIATMPAYPDLLKNMDADLIAADRKAWAEATKDVRDHFRRNPIAWTGVGAAAHDWAAKVFPEIPHEEQMKALWKAIFRACYLEEKEPVTFWRNHLQKLRAISDYLNEERFSALRYVGPGTDLEVGLPDVHVWASGEMMTQSGRTFSANLPTEEVFTTPHREQVNGVVSSTKAMAYEGIIIEDFELEFEAGEIVELSAETGEEHLRNLIETDEGAKRLGEVALVPDSSAISQMDLLFYHTLFDENASSHLALGFAWASSLQGGLDMTEEELLSAGANTSGIHRDFMIGSGELNVDGVRSDGSTERIMNDGEWAIAF